MAGLTRRTTVPDYADGSNTGKPTFNSRNELLAAPALPPRTELSRLGQSWEVVIPNGSPFNLVAAMPTTLAPLALYNGEPVGGKTYVIESVYCLGVASMAAAGSVSLLGQISPAVAALTDNTAVLIFGRNGKIAYGGYGRRALNVTTMVANKWSVLGNSIHGGSATAQIGLAAYADLFGGWLLKPGDTFGVNVIAGTAAATAAIMGIVWSEVQLYHG
jgi:hypothetical protein